MAFLDAFRRKRPYLTPGFAGGYLDDQLDQQQPTGQILTPTNQENITRPRRTYNTTLTPDEETRFQEWKRVNAPNDSGEDYDLRGAFKSGLKPDPRTGHWPDTFKKPNHPTFSNQSQYAQGTEAAKAGTWQRDTYVPPSGTSPFLTRFTQGQQPRTPDEDFPQSRRRIADPTTFDAEHLREIESKPLGLRGKFGLAAQNIATNLGYKPLQTRRQRDVGEIENRLGRDIALDKNRLLREQGQMVPFQLPDGTWTQVPAKSAAVLASRQQGQQQTLSMRRQQMESHNKRWETMGKHEAAQDAQRLYNSGAADDNEDLRDEIAKRMGLPEGTKLPPSTQGQLAVDADGNYILVNKRTGAEKPVTRGERPVTSMQSTLETGRNRRAAAAQAGANQRAAMRQGTDTTRRITPAERRDIAETAAVVNSVHRKLTVIDDQIKNEKDSNKLRTLNTKRQELVEEGALQADKLNRIDPDNEWGSGTGGYPYTKPKVQSAALSAPASSGVTEQRIRDAAKAKGLDPNIAVERARKRGLIP